MGHEHGDSEHERPAVAPRGPRRKGAVVVAAAALAGGAGVQEAAARAGIGRRTLSRWLSSPKFAARVEELKAQATACAVNTLTSAMSLAAETLVGLLDGAPDIQLRAAKTILETGMKLKEHNELVQRITQLEAQAANPTRDAPPLRVVASEDVL
jgi:hypothetical protein